MKLWLIYQCENSGYDTYDSAVVAAETEDQARNVDPESLQEDSLPLIDWENVYRYTLWAHHREAVTATLLGEAVEGTPVCVICASFNAG